MQSKKVTKKSELIISPKEDWGWYEKTINQKPAYIFVNVAFKENVEKKKTKLYLVDVKINKPNKEGLPDWGEFDSLNHIEEAIVKSATKEKAIYVGRITTDGWRRFFLFTKEDKKLENLLQQVLGKFESYKSVVKAYPKKWNVYKKLLYPDKYQYECIMARRMVNQIKEQDATLMTPREIFYNASFKTESDKKAFMAQMVKKGFSLKREPLTVSKADDYLYNVTIKRKDTIDDSVLTTNLDTIMHSIDTYNGEFDGWETTIVSSKNIKVKENSVSSR